MDADLNRMGMTAATTSRPIAQASIGAGRFSPKVEIEAYGFSDGKFALKITTGAASIFVPLDHADAGALRSLASELIHATMPQEVAAFVSVFGGGA